MAPPTKKSKPAKRTKRKATPAQLKALAKARKMKAVRARAKVTPGGSGLIRNRPAARKILG